MNKENNIVEPDTLGLMLKTLKNIGCQPQVNEDKTISVMYQGSEFYMQFSGYFVRICDLVWYVIPSFDPDLPIYREAVNIANYSFGATILLSEPVENGLISLRSRMDIMLHPSCTENEEFVKAILDSFFKTRDNVFNYYDQLKKLDGKPNEEEESIH